MHNSMLCWWMDQALTLVLLMCGEGLMCREGHVKWAGELLSQRLVACMGDGRCGQGSMSTVPVSAQ